MSKLNYTSSEKQNVRSESSWSLSQTINLHAEHVHYRNNLSLKSYVQISLGIFVENINAKD